MAFAHSSPSGFALPKARHEAKSTHSTGFSNQLGGYSARKKDTASTSWLSSKLARIALLATLLFSTGSIATNQQNINVNFSGNAKVVKNFNGNADDTKNLFGNAGEAKKLVTKGNEKNNNGTTISPSLSNFLQKSFGFKTSQWAAILKVERKTLYNWEKNPETKMQSKVVERLLALKGFHDSIDKEHAMFISKMTFGRHSEGAFLSAFNDNDMTSQSLNAVYDDHYIEIDGLYKRLKHSV
ncbi:hypothetical protein SB719_09985 [Pantoea sp. SIMBA_079]|uniref:hypothetical protein n=1 Tax=Pantoea sp. SIMBA_079 TaxID=3085817 RepID=UPI003993C6B9